MDIISPFDIPLLRVVEHATVTRWDKTTRAYANVAPDSGTVRMLIVQDSPETRQMMSALDGRFIWTPDMGYYDYFWVYQDFDTAFRTPAAARLTRGDKIASAKGALEITYVYDDFVPAQFGLCVKIPAEDLAPEPLS